MKKIVWRTPNKMLFESEHATFNHEADLISDGNVWGAVQTSNHIRPCTELECNGRVNALCHLRDFDLSLFPELSHECRTFIRGYTADKSAWLYRFQHHTGNSWRGYRRIVHGYVLTSSSHELVRYWVTGPTYKSHSVILEAIKYITNGGNL